MKCTYKYRINVATLEPRIWRVAVAKETKRYVTLRSGKRQAKAGFEYLDSWHEAFGRLLDLIDKKKVDLTKSINVLLSMPDAACNPRVWDMYEFFDAFSPTLEARK